MAKKKSSSKKAKKTTSKTSSKKTASSTAKKASARKTSRKSSRSASSKKAPAGSGSGNGSKKRKAVKSPLSKSQLKEFREMLIEKRRELIGDMSGIEADALGKFRNNESSEALSMPTHPADVGSDNYEQEFTLGLLESERILLAEINEALERIDNNTYGICLGTGDPIGEPRLRARPWSKYCIEYQRLLEQGLVHPDDDGYGLDEDEDEDENEDEDIEDGREEDEEDSADLDEEDLDADDDDF